MYKQNKHQPTSLKRNTSYVGERLEEKVSRILNNKTPITDGAPLLYTERKDGVIPSTNIRTDRFEIAIDAMDLVAKQHITNRQNRIEEFTKKLDSDNKNQNKNDGGPEPTQATDGPKA